MLWPCKQTERRRVVGEVMELEVPGVRPRGRPTKQLKNNSEEDLREMNLRETHTMDRHSWKAAIESSNQVASSRRRQMEKVRK